MPMKIEIIKFKCDICGKECDGDKAFHLNYPLIFVTNQQDGASSRPYIENKGIDVCHDCADKILKIEASGAMGYDTLKIREAENDEKAD